MRVRPRILKHSRAWLRQLKDAHLVITTYRCVAHFTTFLFTKNSQNIHTISEIMSHLDIDD